MAGKRNDWSGAMTLLAVSGAALLAGPRVPRAPAWSIWARLVAPTAAQAAEPVQGGPADKMWGAALVQARVVREALNSIADPAQRRALEAAIKGGTPVDGTPALVLPQPTGHVAGAAVTVVPAVPGAECGVRPGDGVAVGPVLIGVVQDTEKGVSWFRRITDPDCRVAVTLVPPDAASAKIRGSGVQGAFVAKGRAGRGLLRIDHVPVGTDVRAGDLVLTSGQGGLLPAGLTVGRVVGVDNPDAGTTLEIDVEPAAPVDLPDAVAYLRLRSIKR